jgi:hypothetical protein
MTKVTKGMSMVLKIVTLEGQKKKWKGIWEMTPEWQRLGEMLWKIAKGAVAVVFAVWLFYFVWHVSIACVP